MYYRLTDSQENDFLRLPETGMGYQIVDATKSGSYTRERYIIFNSEIAIEINCMEEYIITLELLMLENNEKIIVRNIEQVELES